MKNYVYPGHPVTIAVTIFRAFPQIEKAFEPSPNSDSGYSNAMVHEDVPGAGGNVHRGIQLVRDLLDSPGESEQLIERAFADWHRQLTTPCDIAYNDRLEPGNAEARALLPELQGFINRQKEKSA